MLAEIAAGTSIASSLFSMSKSNKMTREQKALLDKQAAVAGDMQELSQDQYGLYQDYSGDVFDNLFQEINQQVDYEGATGRATADVNQAYDAQQRADERQKFRYGVNPASGNFQEQQRQNGLSKAITNVDVRNKARREEDDKHWARLLTGANTVQGFLSNSVNAGNAAMGGMQNASSGYGNLANQYAQSAGNGLQTAAYLTTRDFGGGDNGMGNVSDSAWDDSNMNGLTFDQVDW
jgi:hypothetical protein